MNMKKTLLFLLLVLLVSFTYAQKIASPNGKITVVFSLKGGKPFYAVWYENKPVILESALGLITADSALYRNCLLASISPITPVTDHYYMVNTKKSNIVLNG
jgi:hypothetical protein